MDTLLQIGLGNAILASAVALAGQVLDGRYRIEARIAVGAV